MSHYILFVLRDSRCFSAFLLPFQPISTKQSAAAFKFGSSSRDDPLLCVLRWLEAVVEWDASVLLLTCAGKQIQQGSRALASTRLRRVWVSKSRAPGPQPPKQSLARPHGMCTARVVWSSRCWRRGPLSGTREFSVTIGRLWLRRRSNQQ
jgi:hypothetical protein